MTKQIQIKRGDTFDAGCIYRRHSGEPINLIEESVRVTSHVRKPDGELVQVLEFVPVDQTVEPGAYRLRANTAGWPVGQLLWDIKYEHGEAVAHTETILIRCQQSQTP